MEWLVANWKGLLTGILAVLGGFSVLAKLTPWEWDNKIMDKVQKIIDAFGLTK